jgi:hypothetical protein
VLQGPRKLTDKKKEAPRKKGPPSAAATAPALAGEVLCSACGTNNKASALFPFIVEYALTANFQEGYRFCRKCGAKAEAEMAEKKPATTSAAESDGEPVCDKCNVVNKPGYKVWSRMLLGNFFISPAVVALLVVLPKVWRSSCCRCQAASASSSSS